MRVRVIGDSTRLSERFQERIRELEAASAKNDGLNLQIAINYGSRDEMTRAMRRMSEDVAAGKRKPEEITESVFEEYLDTAGIPDPIFNPHERGTQVVQFPALAAGVQ